MNVSRPDTEHLRTTEETKAIRTNMRRLFNTDRHVVTLWALNGQSTCL